MKNFGHILSFLAAALLMGAAASCDPVKCEECTGLDEAPKRHVVLSVGGDAAVTKVFDVEDWQEHRVNSCRLYVFSAEGYQIGHWDNDDGIFDFYLTDGYYDFVAVVNKEGLPGVEATRDDLLQVEVPIEENRLGGMVMTGWLRNHEIFGDEKITVEVKRLVAKVSFVLRSAFEGNMADYSFNVDEIYMTNVPGVTDIGLVNTARPAGDVWYNRMIWDAEAASKMAYPSDMLYQAYDKALAPGDTVRSGPVFYVYPNHVSEDDHRKDEWTPRCTRFVVSARLNGKRTYYAVTINDKDNNGVRRNKHYHLDVTVKDWGTEHPEDNPRDYGAINARFTVDDWDEGGDTAKHF